MEKTPMSDHTSHTWIKDIREGDSVQGLYAVRDKRLGKTRRGDAFLTVSLADRTGDVEAKVWEQAEEVSSRFKTGDVLDIQGNATSYRDRIQLTLSQFEVVNGEVDYSLFLEPSAESPRRMVARLRKLLQEIRNPHLKALIEQFFSDAEFMRLFEKAPAAKNFHHNYLGGLLEHTLSVCEIIQQVADHYPHLDRDLLLAGAFCHDIGKVRELSWDLQIEYTDEGRLVGHLVQGTLLVEKKLAGLKTFPQDLALRLKHLILSHHGEYEFGSPKRPKFLEAFVLHLADDLDAKVNGLGRLFERDGREGAWTDYSRLFERYFLKGNDHQMEEGHNPDEKDEGKQGNLF
jgi:3'-5' exoribonuclease